MKDFLSTNWAYLLVSTIIAASIAYGINPDSFIRGFALTAPIIWTVTVYLIVSNSPDLEAQEIIKTMDQMSAEQGEVITEQGAVIKEYEEIFDSLLVELPCVCGGNTFRGLFSPNTDNVVQCEKCKEHYRVDINYNSVLISTPLDVEQTFDKLVSDND